MKNKLTIYFQRKQNGGGEVVAVTYPSTQPDQAVITFRSYRGKESFRSGLLSKLNQAGLFYSPNSGNTNHVRSNQGKKKANLQRLTVLISIIINYYNNNNDSSNNKKSKINDDNNNNNHQQWKRLELFNIFKSTRD